MTTQLDLLFGRVLRLPADADGSFDAEFVDLVPVVVDLSPAQSTWMGLDEPARPGCPGCLLFGRCALHDTAA